MDHVTGIVIGDSQRSIDAGWFPIGVKHGLEAAQKGFREAAFNQEFMHIHHWHSEVRRSIKQCVIGLHGVAAA
tara:strand:+ start:3179 stop:3397 length:219 start_codon:yes stop_codon:yes gene_type:complete